MGIGAIINSNKQIVTPILKLLKLIFSPIPVCYHLKYYTYTP